MSTTDTEDDPTQAFVRALFGTDDETGEAAEQTDDEPVKPTGNYVPLEGNIPKAKDDTDAQFIRILFDHN